MLTYAEALAGPLLPWQREFARQAISAQPHGLHTVTSRRAWRSSDWALAQVICRMFDAPPRLVVGPNARNARLLERNRKARR